MKINTSILDVLEETRKLDIISKDIQTLNDEDAEELSDDLYGLLDQAQEHLNGSYDYEFSQDDYLTYLKVKMFLEIYKNKYNKIYIQLDELDNVTTTFKKFDSEEYIKNNFTKLRDSMK